MTPRKGPRKASHCAYELHYHFVFVVKYRRALLRPEIEAELVRLSYEVAERYELEIESIGADTNHIHLLCSAHPKTSPGDIARIYKSITAIQLFKSFPELRKELWGGSFWTSGYYVASVGLRGGWQALVRYIANPTLQTRERSQRRSTSGSCSHPPTRTRTRSDTQGLAPAVLHCRVF